MTTALAPKRPPAGLGPRGRAFWRDINSAYTLTASESALVRVAAAAVDQLHRIELAIKASPVTSTGSAGQLTEHPLLSSWRAHAESIRKVCRQLDLPDLVEQPTAPPKKKSSRIMAAGQGRITRGA